MQTKTYQWTLIAQLQSGHRLFQERSGRLALADNSGKTPSTTEDGPLWIAISTNATAGTSGVQVPVIQGDQSADGLSVTGTDCVVGVEIADIPMLIKHGITVTPTATLRGQITMWAEVMVALATQR